MNFKHVFIITYGRTGSTLLQGLLNSIDGYCVRGENFNLCYGLFRSYQSLHKLLQKTESEKSDFSSVTNPFYGAHLFDISSFKKSIYETVKTQLIINQEKKVMCWGFKEVRYTPRDFEKRWDSTLKDYLSFINEIFPESAFIFLTRDHDKVLKSGFWTQTDKDNALKNIAFFEKESKEWSDNKKNCFWIAYEDIVNTNSRLEGLYSFLGEQYDKENILKTLSIEHSYAGKKENLDKTKKLHTQEHEKPKKARLKIKRNESEFIAHAFIDNEKDFNTFSPEKITLGGVILLEETTYKHKPKLTLSTKEEKYEAIWGLPSPLVRELYPEHQFSGKSRFRFDNVKLGTTARITLEFDSLYSITLFEINNIQTS